MRWIRCLGAAAVLVCGATALVGCGSAGNGQAALFAGGDGWFGESPAKPGLYDDQGWPVQRAAVKAAPDQDVQRAPDNGR